MKKVIAILILAALTCVGYSQVTIQPLQLDLTADNVLGMQFHYGKYTALVNAENEAIAQTNGTPIVAKSQTVWFKDWVHNNTMRTIDRITIEYKADRDARIESKKAKMEAIRQKLAELDDNQLDAKLDVIIAYLNQ